MKESIVQKEILETLYKIPDSKVLRINNTPIFDPKLNRFRKSNNRFQPDGISDIFFFYKGQVFFIEVKTPKEFKYLMRNYDEIKNGNWKLRSGNSTVEKKRRLQNQIIFIDEMTKLGFKGFFTCDSRDTLEKVKGIKNF